MNKTDVAMTSDIDVLKTNEFLRRRKLRLQQVREQSKDIAKKIRQRAKVEKLRQVTDIDSKREKEYFECQEKLVKRLELLYSKSLDNVGASHKKALEVNQPDVVEKTDLSQLRGKEAVAEVRKRKQEKLDEQKKLLDRKLQAREVANEISREKTSIVNKNLNKQTKKSDPQDKPASSADEINNKEDIREQDGTKNNPNVVKADMGTQWESGEILNEWEPNIPALSIPKDDTALDAIENTEKSDKSRKFNLFALSDEMPSSLRGGLSSAPVETATVKPSLTLVSEYLQNRNLRLREFEPTKKSADDLQSIKQTLLRTRATRTDVSGNKEKSFKSTDPEITTRKKCISIYNHNTRDIKDVPYADKRIVTHDSKCDEDAYSQALQETASANQLEKEKLNRRQQDIRNRVAITKQNVDKEYKDTLAFLNSLSKDKDINYTKTYQDDQQQQLQRDNHQRKMQQEFIRIEKECHKQNCKHNKRKSTIVNKTRNKPKSPINISEPQRKDFEYSWMPVPESDENFAIHTIPTTTKNKSGNTVKFSEPSNYHEYRSRHKHTPPTKDINENKHSKQVIETVIVHQNGNGSDESENSASETSSVENLSLENDKSVPQIDSKLRDADRIIIYKILNSRNKKHKVHKKSESITNNEKNSISVQNDSDKQKSVNLSKSGNNRQKEGCFEHLQEGVYKGVRSEEDNITSMRISEAHEEQRQQVRSNDKHRQPCCCERDLTKADDKDYQKESGDNTSRPKNQNISCYCGKRSKENNLQLQPPEAVSTSSFKTAPNDKADSMNANNEFMKLVDNGGQESGKFYIGASGFVKDDNYEVIIQLRKKDGEKLNNHDKVAVTDSTSEKSNVLATAENNDNTEDKGISDGLTKNVEENASSLRNVITTGESSDVVANDNALLNCEQNTLGKEHSKGKISEPTTKVQKSNMCEKAVLTSFEDSYAVPAHLPKTDNLPRPATSTYTQTSFNSSIQRPVFMHMSSSTSTAYMSPPELLLPKFLKNDYIMTHEELFESENTINEINPQYEVIERDCQEFDECNCKCCANTKKVNVKPKTKQTTSTPPNTARSSHRCRLTNEMKERKLRKCKCHKCKCSSETKICRKTCRKRTKSENTNLTKDVPYENKNNKMQTSRRPMSSSCSKDNGDTTINPIVKNYVNKLLALNKESLKAVDIINQDCSVASTPASSIINIPSNNDKQHHSAVGLENKISLEQIKNLLKQQILNNDCYPCPKNTKCTDVKSTESQTEKNLKFVSRFPKKKSVHKVKSLNISRQLLHKKKSATRRTVCNPKIITSTSSSARDEKQEYRLDEKKTKLRNKSSSTSKQIERPEYKNSTSSDIGEPANMKRFITLRKNYTKEGNNSNHKLGQNFTTAKSHQIKNLNLRATREKVSYNSSDSEIPGIVLKHLTPPQSPTNISIQTNGSEIDVETNFMKIAEDKLQNMEKIADLTEKCTKRLSNLAKVLEEVRKNKSLVYSQISTSESTSESDNKSDKNQTTDMPLLSPPNDLKQNSETHQAFSITTTTTTKPSQSLTISASFEENKLCTKDSAEYVPFLTDIPKPISFVTLSKDNNTPANDKATLINNSAIEFDGVKVRGRPPPALSRINLKNGQEIISVTPHELSTVMEVDSPMSVKLKNQASRYETKVEDYDKIKIYENTDSKNERRIDPDLLQSNVTDSKKQSKVLSTDSDDYKLDAMELKHFNNIMLKPFITLQEYAKQCNIGLEEGSNVEDAVKDDVINEDLSSLHSDGSLPDVIAELLKRNIISEPFKFDNVSNGNSTTFSSESTMSVLALSKSKRDKKKSANLLKNKENHADTSETLSISSNPDLENAFQKLGMGWASSTLKKTKERLALSSSSNTSSSSMPQLKIKTFSQVMPTLATDSTSSLLDISNERNRKKVKSPSRNVKDSFKNAVQQTALTNSMTVKEFLTNELAKKITFSNKSTRKEVDEEFVSLYETKIPEDMKNSNIDIKEDDPSIASNNVRARTSTPVQLFKSTTYNSTSSTNTSNGLFSNADDLSSVKGTSNSMRNHSTSDKDDLTIPNYSLKRKELSDFSKSD